MLKIQINNLDIQNSLFLSIRMVHLCDRFLIGLHFQIEFIKYENKIHSLTVTQDFSN